jgi:hypothetical protein
MKDGNFDMEDIVMGSAAAGSGLKKVTEISGYSQFNQIPTSL